VKRRKNPLREITLAVIPGTGGTQRMPRAAGRARHAGTAAVRRTEPRVALH
jgi:enoyl-CoA hydratase/carnithine racemase